MKTECVVDYTYGVSDNLLYKICVEILWLLDYCAIVVVTVSLAFFCAVRKLIYRFSVNKNRACWMILTPPTAEAAGRAQCEGCVSPLRTKTLCHMPTPNDAAAFARFALDLSCSLFSVILSDECRVERRWLAARTTLAALSPPSAVRRRYYVSPAAPTRRALWCEWAIVARLGNRRAV